MVLTMIMIHEHISHNPYYTTTAETPIAPPAALWKPVSLSTKDPSRASPEICVTRFRQVPSWDDAVAPDELFVFQTVLVTTDFVNLKLITSLSSEHFPWIGFKV